MPINPIKMPEFKISQKTLETVNNAMIRISTKASIRSKNEAEEIIIREVTADKKGATRNPLVQGAVDFLRSLKNSECKY